MIIRDRKFLITLAFMILVMIIGIFGMITFPNYAASVGVLSFCVIIVLFILFQMIKYKEIRKLSEYLTILSQGKRSLDIRDNEEGELSILKSEIYKVSLRLMQQSELLEKDKKFLGDAIADISHQLKTPLTSMFVMIDLLEDEKLPKEKRIQFTNNIRNQLNRIEWLIASMLKMAKLDANTIAFKEENVNVKELIQKSMQHLLIPLEIKNQTIVMEIDDNINYIGDKNWMVEAISNIFKNCIENTPVNGNIQISVSENIMYMQIEVSDNGIGMDTQDAARIFERFYKGKNSSNESVGIGMALVQKIINMQGGAIEVKSEIDKGTTFIIKMYKKLYRNI